MHGRTTKQLQSHSVRNSEIKLNSETVSREHDGEWN